jgi:hypothetical protein
MSTSGCSSIRPQTQLQVCVVVQVKVQTVPGYANGLMDGMPKVLAQEGVGGCAHASSVLHRIRTTAGDKQTIDHLLCQRNNSSCVPGNFVVLISSSKSWYNMILVWC